MRCILVVALLVLLSMPACSATPPIVPALTLTLSPSSMEVTVTSNAKASVAFNGTVQVDKLPFVRIVVTLVPSVDQGFASSCGPSSIVVMDEQPHSFVCNVTVPEGLPNLTANLTVAATGSGGGFTVTATATVIIVVHGITLYNQTGGTGGTGKTGTNQTNQTVPGGNQSSQGGPFKLGPLDATGIAVLILVMAVAAGYGAYRVRRRRNARRRMDWSEEAPVEEVQAL